jgi:hypothetical protein
MTDLPEDDDKRLKRQVFNQLIALKAENQVRKRKALAAWQAQYHSLDDEARARVDEELRKKCDEIAAQFGKPQPYRKP